MSFLIVILFIITLTDAYCTYTQNYWLTQPNAWSLLEASSSQNWTLCNTQWYSLMSLDTLQLRDFGSAYFLMNFHQVCTTTLNIALIESTYDSNLSEMNPLDEYYNVSHISASMAILLDSLQRGCQNATQWSQEAIQDPLIGGLYRTLSAFNDGISQPGSCSDEFSLVQPFSLQNTTSLFTGDFTIYPFDINLVTKIYHTQTGLFIVSALAYLFILPLLAFYISLLYSGRTCICINRLITEEIYEMKQFDDIVASENENIEPLDRNPEDYNNNPTTSDGDLV